MNKFSMLWSTTTTTTATTTTTTTPKTIPKSTWRGFTELYFVQIVCVLFYLSRSMSSSLIHFSRLHVIINKYYAAELIFDLNKFSCDQIRIQIQISIQIWFSDNEFVSHRLNSVHFYGISTFFVSLVLLFGMGTILCRILDARNNDFRTYLPISSHFTLKFRFLPQAHTRQS